MFVPKADTLAFVNMKGSDEKAKRAFPADLCYIESVEKDVITVRWYGCVNWSTQKSLERNKKKKEEDDVVFFKKHWKIACKKKLLAALHIKSDAEKPSIAAVSDCWSRDHYAAGSGVFLPVDVPSPGKDEIWSDEVIGVPKRFLRDTLIPVCKEQGCVKD